MTLGWALYWAMIVGAACSLIVARRASNAGNNPLAWVGWLWFCSVFLLLFGILLGPVVVFIVTYKLAAIRRPGDDPPTPTSAAPAEQPAGAGQ